RRAPVRLWANRPGVRSSRRFAGHGPAGLRSWVAARQPAAYLAAPPEPRTLEPPWARRRTRGSRRAPGASRASGSRAGPPVFDPTAAGGRAPLATGDGAEGPREGAGLSAGRETAPVARPSRPWPRRSTPPAPRSAAPAWARAADSAWARAA